MENNNMEVKMDYLISLGLEIEDANCYNGGTEGQIDFYDQDGRIASIQLDEFSIGDSLSSIFAAAEYYSCCGDLLDKDYMICPTCKEHC